MSQVPLLLLYLVLIVASSLVGGVLPLLYKVGHTWRQTILSLVGGLMLGVALLHMLPHAIAETGRTELPMASALFGLLSFFLIIRILRLHPPHHGEPHRCDGHPHWHVHVLQDEASADRPADGGPSSPLLPLAPPPADHAADQAHQEIAWMGVVMGLGLHSFLDGIALAASVAAGHGEAVTVPAGLGAFLAIMLHKPFDALAVTTMMTAERWTPRGKHVANLLFALICPLGAACFHLGVGEFSIHPHVVVGLVLAFAAGVFLCIALADLLPEVQFHAHDRIKLTVALLLGVAIAAAIVLLEPTHPHPPR